MRCAVIGAGISGCVIARMLADTGNTIVLYEAQSSPGGILLRMSDVTVNLVRVPIHDWLTARCAMQRLSLEQPYLYIPRYGYEVLCKEVLSHPSIVTHLNASVSQPWELTRTCNHVFFTGDVARLCQYAYGQLTYDAVGMPIADEQSMNTAALYRSYLQQLGIVPFGMHAAHDPLSIWQIITDAARCVEKILG